MSVRDRVAAALFVLALSVALAGAWLAWSLAVGLLVVAGLVLLAAAALALTGPFEVVDGLGSEPEPLDAEPPDTVRVRMRSPIASPRRVVGVPAPAASKVRP